ncbi:MAG: murein biosynthesis integral membrane protein MurJ, partial [Myxococcales bacterium]|nr:murein biosynthesis integral membrane protein MurJ [Myxococcales bacterium]
QGAIARRAGLLAAGTLLSRILGAARDAVFAASFSVGATDAFYMAFTIPNALRVLLGEGAVSGAFVPVYTEVREKEGRARAGLFFSRLLGAMLLLLLGVSLLGVLFAPGLVTLYAGGYRDDPELFADTVTLVRVVFPYIFLMGLAALFTGALQAEKRFTAPALAPATLNVAFIGAALLLTPFALGLGLPAVGALALGALLGGALQGLVQLPALRGAGLLQRPRIDFRDPYVRKAFRLLIPLLAGLGVYQLNVMLARQLASHLPEGSVSYLYYSQRLVELPQGMFAMAIASAALPTLSELRARGEAEETRRIFRYALRLALFVAIPASVALTLLAEPITAVLFGRGSFGSTQIVETARALRVMALGIWAVAAVRTVVPMFHAYNDTRTPVIGSAINLLTFGLVAAALMQPLGHVGLAAAISAAAAAQLGTLLLLLRHREGPLGLREVLGASLRILLATAPMALVLEGITAWGHWRERGGDLQNVGVFLLAVAAGALTFLLSAKLLGVREVGELSEALGARLRRRRERRHADES